MGKIVREALVLLALALMLALLFNAVSPKSIKLLLPGKSQTPLRQVPGNEEGEKGK